MGGQATLSEDAVRQLLSGGWAVHTEYIYVDMTTRIGKIEKWNPYDHFLKPSILHIVGARDELEAYTKALEIINARNHV